MSWWSRKPDPPKKNVISFSKADRPDVIERLRRNAERSPRLRPVEPPQERKENCRQSFVPADFQSVDNVLYKARADIRRGLINPTACIIVTYDQDRSEVVWYQYGCENDEADAALRDWLNEVVFDE